MAVACTHFRMALDTLRLFNVQDERAFLAGSVYPDSRYLTGIRRAMTHGPDRPRDPFALGLTDFEKGWALHLLHDRLSFRPYCSLAPWNGETVEFGDRVWVHLSAEKVVEDMMSFDALGGTAAGLMGLPCPLPPSGESAEKLERYFFLIGQMYSRRPTFERYKEMWVAYGGQASVADAINGVAAEMLSDAAKVSRIGSIYGQVFEQIIGMSRQTRLT